MLTLSLLADCKGDKGLSLENGKKLKAVVDAL